MKKIQLTKGQFSIVDDEDYKTFSCFNWYAQKGNGGLYAARREKGKIVFLHRKIIKATEGYEVDHINGDTLDNQRNNLRIVTRRQNAQNSKKRKGSLSKYKGVTWNKERNKWQAQIKVDGKQLFLGHFRNEISAAKSYDKAAVKYFGDYARINTYD